LKAQQHMVTYDSPIDILSIVKDICNLKQICTQSGGLRPFGVSLLIAGIDEDGVKLFETDPTGLFYQFKATAIGEGELEIDEILHKEYKDGLTIEEGLVLAVKALKKVLDDKLTAERIDTAYILEKKRTVEKFSKDKIKKLLKEK